MTEHEPLPTIPPTTPLQKARHEIAEAIMGELWAQLDDLSDDTEGLITSTATERAVDEDALRSWADDFRLTMVATIDQRHSDYLADNA